MLLRWKSSVFRCRRHAVGSLENAAAERQAEDLVLTLLNRFNGQDRNVSDKVGPSYAPALFAKGQEARTKQESERTRSRLPWRRLFGACQDPHGALRLPVPWDIRIAAGQKP